MTSAIPTKKVIISIVDTYLSFNKTNSCGEHIFSFIVLDIFTIDCNSEVKKCNNLLRNLVAAFSSENLAEDALSCRFKLGVLFVLFECLLESVGI